MKFITMDQNEFEKRMQERRERWMQRRHRNGKGRIWGGLFLLVIGTLFLAKAAGVLFPGWFFTWPVLLIGIGIFSGIKHRFRRAGWLIPVAIGGIFLADNLSTGISLKPYLWPALLIGAGLFIIFRPKGRNHRRGGGCDDDDSTTAEAGEEGATATVESEDWQRAANDRADVIDATAVFGGVKKNVLTKTFKGGDITTFMGGAEINLTQADFNGRVMIDCFNMFGGTKLIVPPDWEIQSDITAIFGGVDDKRPPATAAAQNKVLYLDGTCLFGGLEIRSY